MARAVYSNIARQHKLHHYDQRKTGREEHQSRPTDRNFLFQPRRAITANRAGLEGVQGGKGENPGHLT